MSKLSKGRLFDSVPCSHDNIGRQYRKTGYKKKLVFVAPTRCDLLETFMTYSTVEILKQYLLIGRSKAERWVRP
jgi:hypothetical protein